MSLWIFHVLTGQKNLTTIHLLKAFIKVFDVKIKKKKKVFHLLSFKWGKMFKGTLEWAVKMSLGQIYCSIEKSRTI